MFNFGYFRPSEYFNPDDDYFLNRFFADRISSGKSEKESINYKNYSEDYLLLPKWVKQRPLSLSNSVFSSDTVSITNFKEINAVNFSAKVNSKAGKVMVNKIYYPGWNIYVDGERKEADVISPLGNMAVDIGEGEHRLELKWEETRLRKIVNHFSLLSLFTAIVLVFKSNEKSSKK